MAVCLARWFWPSHGNNLATTILNLLRTIPVPGFARAYYYEDCTIRVGYNGVRVIVQIDTDSLHSAPCSFLCFFSNRNWWKLIQRSFEIAQCVWVTVFQQTRSSKPGRYTWLTHNYTDLWTVVERPWGRPLRMVAQRDNNGTVFTFM